MSNCESLRCSRELMARSRAIICIVKVRTRSIRRGVAGIVNDFMEGRGGRYPFI